MPAMVGVSINMPELKAESLPLPESPAKFDEPATRYPTSSLQEMPQIVTPRAHSANDDDIDDMSVDSAKNAVFGSNMPENDTSNSSAADVHNDQGDFDHGTANKDDSKPVNDLETVSEDDSSVRSISVQPKTDEQSVQNENIALTCNTNDQFVNSADIKREYLLPSKSANCA